MDTVVHSLPILRRHSPNKLRLSELVKKSPSSSCYSRASLRPIASRGNEKSHGEVCVDGDGDLEVAAARAQSPGRKKGWQSERDEGVPSINDERTERGWKNCLFLWTNSSDRLHEMRAKSEGIPTTDKFADVIHGCSQESC